MICNLCKLEQKSQMGSFLHLIHSSRILLLLFFWAFRNQIWELPNIAIDVPEKKEGILIVCGPLCSLLLPLLNGVLSVKFLPFDMCFSFWLFGL